METTKISKITGSYARDRNEIFGNANNLNMMNKVCDKKLNVLRFSVIVRQFIGTN